MASRRRRYTLDQIPDSLKISKLAYDKNFYIHMPIRNLRVDDKINLKGTIGREPTLFRIKLFNLRTYEVMLRATVNYKLHLFTRNSKIITDGDWGYDDSEGGFPFTAPMIIEMAFVVRSTHFEIFINQKLHCTYKHRGPFDKINVLSIVGDVSVSQIDGFMGGEMFIWMPDVRNLKFEEIVMPIMKPSLGQTIWIKAKINPFAKWFEIEIIRRHAHEIPLHLSFDIGSEKAWVNSKPTHKGPWQTPTPFQGITFKLPMKVVFAITFGTEQFKVKLNNQEFCTYVYTCPFERADALRIRGDIKVQSITIDQLDLPKRGKDGTIRNVIHRESNDISDAKKYGKDANKRYSFQERGTGPTRYAADFSKVQRPGVTHSKLTQTQKIDRLHQTTRSRGGKMFHRSSDDNAAFQIETSDDVQGADTEETDDTQDSHENDDDNDGDDGNRKKNKKPPKDDDPPPDEGFQPPNGEIQPPENNSGAPDNDGRSEDRSKKDKKGQPPHGGRRHSDRDGQPLDDDDEPPSENRITLYDDELPGVDRQTSTASLEPESEFSRRSIDPLPPIYDRPPPSYDDEYQTIDVDIQISIENLQLFKLFRQPSKDIPPPNDEWRPPSYDYQTPDIENQSSNESLEPRVLPPMYDHPPPSYNDDSQTLDEDLSLAESLQPGDVFPRPPKDVPPPNFERPPPTYDSQTTDTAQLSIENVQSRSFGHKLSKEFFQASNFNYQPPVEVRQSSIDHRLSNDSLEALNKDILSSDKDSEPFNSNGEHPNDKSQQTESDDDSQQLLYDDDDEQNESVGPSSSEEEIQSSDEDELPNKSQSSRNRRRRPRNTATFKRATTRATQTRSCSEGCIPQKPPYNSYWYLRVGNDTN